MALRLEVGDRIWIDGQPYIVRKIRRKDIVIRLANPSENIPYKTMHFAAERRDSFEKEAV